MKYIKDNWVNRRYLKMGRRHFPKRFFNDFYGMKIPSIATYKEKEKSERLAEETHDKLKWE